MEAAAIVGPKPRRVVERVDREVAVLVVAARMPGLALEEDYLSAHGVQKVNEVVVLPEGSTYMAGRV